MVCDSASKSVSAPKPYSDLAAFLVERNYTDLGCGRWDTRRVRLLMAKIGDTPLVMAARLRLTPKEFERRLEKDVWTKQDGLILTMIDREIDFLKGGALPAGNLVKAS